MKKYILVLLLTIFIIPSIALASWWNPFSWKVFNKTPEIKIEKPITIPDKPVDTSIQKTKEEPKTTAQSKNPPSSVTKNESVSKIVNQKVSDLTDTDTWEITSVWYPGKILIVPNYSERIRMATIVCNFIETDYKNLDPLYKKFPYCSEGKTSYVFIKSHLKDIEDSRNSKKDTSKAWEKILGFLSFNRMSELNNYIKDESITLNSQQKSETEASQSINTTLCNGKYLGNCTTGKQFFCPTIGDPSCVDPNTSTLCNGKYWNNCAVGKQFYCPETGDASCVSPVTKIVEQKQNTPTDWVTLETNGFIEANQKNWNSLNINNGNGEKRYYRKEGNQWVRKNSEEETKPDNTSQDLIKAVLDASIANQNALIAKQKLEEQARIAESARLENLIKQSQNTQYINPQPAITPPPVVQTPSINCSNYQTEKNNLDEYYASRGLTFSGTRNRGMIAFDAKYASCF